MADSDDDTDSPNYLIWLIIALVGLLILVSIVLYLKNAQKNNVQQSECFMSIDQHAKFVSMSDQEVVPDIHCPTYRISISKNENDKQANAKIAEAWYSCWNDWHRGNVNLFRNSGVYCHVCSIISFEDRQQLNGLYTYLDTQKIKKLNANITYLQYLTPFATEQKDEIPSLPVQFDPAIAAAYGDSAYRDTIQLNNSQYAIIFVYAKGQDVIKDLLSGQRGTFFAIGTAGMFIGGSAVAAGVATAGTTALVTGSFVILSGPVGWLVVGGASAIAVSGAYLYTSIFVGNDPPQWMSFSTFRPYDQDVLQKLGCEIAPANQ